MIWTVERKERPNRMEQKWWKVEPRQCPTHTSKVNYYNNVAPTVAIHVAIHRHRRQQQPRQWPPSRTGWAISRSCTHPFISIPTDGSCLDPIGSDHHSYYSLYWFRRIILFMYDVINDTGTLPPRYAPYSVLPRSIICLTPPIVIPVSLRKIRYRSIMTIPRRYLDRIVIVIPVNIINPLMRHIAPIAMFVWPVSITTAFGCPSASVWAITR